MKHFSHIAIAIFVFAFALVANTYAQTIDANGTLTFPEGTTETGVRAFVSNTEITSVVFPASLKTISNYSFMGCTNLKEVVIPSTVTTIGTSAFNGSGVRSVEIEEGCKSIGGYAFNGCKSLVRLVIPSTVTSIGASSVPSSARIECPKGSYAEQWATKNGYITSNNSIIDSNGLLTISEGVPTIRSSAYLRNDSIRNIQLPSTLKSIGNSAFYGCVYIETDHLILPDGVEKIGKEAFDRCVNIRKVSVPSSVTEIGDKAFHANATLVVEPNSVAHQWAIDNNHDYQFSAEGLPEGVSEVFADYFLKTAWDQGGRNFTPEGERVFCQNLASAMMIYNLGLHYQGSHYYKTSQGSYYVDYDSETVDYSKIPLYFYGKPNSELGEADKLLWQQCVMEERPWGTSERVGCNGAYKKNMMIHAPVKTASYDENDKPAAEEMLKRNFAIKRPVMIYSYGVGGEPSHVWILDGARIKNGKFQVHCDFGWYANHNGWYDLWETILDYDSGRKALTEFTPLEGEELANWKPYRVDLKDLVIDEDGNIFGDEGETTLTDGALTIAVGNVDLASSAYENNNEIRSVAFPSTLKTIGSKSFMSCTNLKQVVIPGSVREIGASSFHSSGLENVVVEDGCREIGGYAFYKANALKEITIPSSVISIGASALPKTTKIRCPEGSYAEQWALENGYMLDDEQLIKDSVLTIPEGVKEIATDVYANYTNINTLVIPTTVTKINQRAFKNCTNLQTVHFNAVASAISGTGVNSAFYGCSNLKKVVVGEGVTTIPPQIFLQCTALETIEIPASVFEINTKPFPKTTIVVCPEGSYAEKWAIENGYKLADEQLIKDSMLTLPEGLNEIAADIYANRTDFNALVIPSTVTKIDQRAFKNCTDLQTIYFNSILSSIAGEKGNAPFAGCTGLKKVVVGEGCTKISRTIFSQCTALDTIEIPASVTTIGDNPFPKTTTVVCPAGSYAEQWARENGYSVVLPSADSGIDDHFASRSIIVEGGLVSSTVDGLRIFNLLGQDVTHLNGSLRGIYIVRIGGEVMKVVVK